MGSSIDNFDYISDIFFGALYLLPLNHVIINYMVYVIRYENFLLTQKIQTRVFFHACTWLIYEVHL